MGREVSKAGCLGPCSGALGRLNLSSHEGREEIKADGEEERSLWQMEHKCFLLGFFSFHHTLILT